MKAVCDALEMGNGHSSRVLWSYGLVIDDVLVRKADELRESLSITDTDFKISHGWLQRFKLRHEIACHYLHGEAGDADAAAGVALAMEKMPSILKDYDPHDVFNFDETGLYH